MTRTNPGCISVGKRTRPFEPSRNLAQYGETPGVLYVQLQAILWNLYSVLWVEEEKEVEENCYSIVLWKEATIDIYGKSMIRSPIRRKYTEDLIKIFSKCQSFVIRERKKLKFSSTNLTIASNKAWCWLPILSNSSIQQHPEKQNKGGYWSIQVK